MLVRRRAINVQSLAVYIHIPYCLNKCPYCSFYSRPYNGDEGALYIECIKKELELRGELLAGRKVTSLYIGGGTPSLLPVDDWEKLIALLENKMSFSAFPEVSVEVNPGAVSVKHLLMWKDWRVTRISIGVQSFDDAELQFLGRMHSSAQAIDTLAACRLAGFDVSIDLMFGLPHAPFKNWARTLHQASEMEPQHISLYQLSIEEGSAWATSNMTLPDGYHAYRFAQRYLEQKGYAQYEISSFARKGHESQHNLVYWSDKEYLGIGASSWGYLKNERYQNEPSIKRYEKKLVQGQLPIAHCETLNLIDHYREAAVLALRTSSGINWAQFSENYGIEAALDIKKRLKDFPEKWVCVTDRGAFLTSLGFCVGNQIWSEII